MTTTRIGVVTDTHVGDELPALPNEVLERLAEVDLVVHAGDLVEPDILEDLARVAPVIAVRGNHDRNRSLPHSALLRVGQTTLVGTSLEGPDVKAVILAVRPEIH